MRIERERCCDEIAVGLSGDRTAYAKLLLWLEESRGKSSIASPALSATGGTLMERIKYLADPRMQPVDNGGLYALVLLSSAIVAGSLWFITSGGVNQFSHAGDDVPNVDFTWNDLNSASYSINDDQVLMCLHTDEQLIAVLIARLPGQRSSESVHSSGDLSQFSFRYDWDQTNLTVRLNRSDRHQLHINAQSRQLDEGRVFYWDGDTGTITQQSSLIDVPLTSNVNFRSKRQNEQAGNLLKRIQREFSQQTEKNRYSFPDASPKSENWKAMRLFTGARDSMEQATWDSTTIKPQDRERIRESLARLSVEFPDDSLGIYAKRRLIILDWQTGQISAVAASSRLKQLDDSKDKVEGNFTLAMAMTIDARSFDLESIQHSLGSLSSDQTRQFGWFAFEWAGRFVRDYPHRGVSNAERRRGQPIDEEHRRSVAVSNWLETQLLNAIEQSLKYTEKQYAEHSDDWNPDPAKDGLEAAQMVLALEQIANSTREILARRLYPDVSKRATETLLPQTLDLWERAVVVLEASQSTLESPDDHRQKIRVFREKLLPQLERMWHENMKPKRLGTLRNSNKLAGQWLGTMGNVTVHLTFAEDEIRWQLHDGTITTASVFRRVMDRSGSIELWYDYVPEIGSDAGTPKTVQLGLLRNGEGSSLRVRILPDENRFKQPVDIVAHKVLDSASTKHIPGLRGTSGSVWFQSADQIHFVICNRGFLQSGLAYSQRDISPRKPHRLWHFSGHLNARPGRDSKLPMRRLPLVFEYETNDGFTLQFDGRAYDLADGRLFLVSSNGKLKQIEFPLSSSNSDDKSRCAWVDTVIQQFDTQKTAAGALDSTVRDQVLRNISFEKALTGDSSYGRDPEKHLGQTQSIAAWQAIVNSDGLTREQQVFAWWRIGSLAAYNFDVARGESNDNDLAAKALERVHAIGGELISRETLNAATVYGSLGGDHEQRATRKETADDWLRSRTDAMIANSVKHINHNGYCIDGSLMPGGMNLDTAAKKREYLEKELARCRDSLTPRNSASDRPWNTLDEVVQTQIKTAAQRLLDATGKPTWKLESVDKQPTANVDGFRGYRIVLCRTWKEYTNPPQQSAEPDAAKGPFELKHEEWQFVLIPTEPQQVPAKLRSKIPWGKSLSPYHTRDVCVGEGFGFVWFTHGTLFGQEFVREKLKLQGGDDRIALMIEGMRVTDAQTMTANSCQRAITRFGDTALPGIRRAIKNSEDRYASQNIIGSLAFVHTDKAAELLVQLYGSEKNDVRTAAAYTLVHEPFRPIAKDVYIDMLRSHQHVYESCRACVQFEWKDAVPVLNDLIVRPVNLRELSFTIPARRTLQGNPIPQQLLDAKQKILAAGNDSDRGIDQQRKLLFESDDSAATLLIAIELATHVRKGSSRQINEIGIDLLQNRPRQSTIDYFQGLTDAMSQKNRRQTERLLQVVTSTPSGVEN